MNRDLCGVGRLINAALEHSKTNFGASADCQGLANTPIKSAYGVFM